MAGPSVVYVFRGSIPSPTADTVVSVAPLDLVTSAFGGRIPQDEGGLAAAFGGAVVFHNDETGQSYIGVWGARNCSRFRTMLRKADASLRIVREPPPARLVRWMTTGKRTKPIAVER